MEDNEVICAASAGPWRNPPWIRSSTCPCQVPWYDPHAFHYPMYQSQVQWIAPFSYDSNLLPQGPFYPPICDANGCLVHPFYLAREYVDSNSLPPFASFYDDAMETEQFASDCAFVEEIKPVSPNPSSLDNTLPRELPIKICGKFDRKLVRRQKTNHKTPYQKERKAKIQFEKCQFRVRIVLALIHHLMPHCKAQMFKNVTEQVRKFEFSPTAPEDKQKWICLKTEVPKQACLIVYELAKQLDGFSMDHVSPDYLEEANNLDSLLLLRHLHDYIFAGVGPFQVCQDKTLLTQELETCKLWMVDFANDPTLVQELEKWQQTRQQNFQRFSGTK